MGKSMDKDMGSKVKVNEFKDLSKEQQQQLQKIVDAYRQYLSKCKSSQQLIQALQELQELE